MSDNISVDIVLPVYNGEKYLSEQLDSLISQTYENVRIIIRDDGSKDNSLKIIKKYVRKYPDKFLFIDDNKTHLGLNMSFNELLNYSNADLVAFSDQDDVWDPRKIEIVVNEYLKLKKFTVPFFFYHLREVVDEHLKLIHFIDSIEERSISSVLKYKFHNFMLRSLPGNVLVINDILRELVMPFPKTEEILYDCYVSRIGFLFGKSKFISRKLVKYRIHSGQSVSSVTKNTGKIFKFTREIPNFLNKNINVMNGILKRYGERLDPYQRRVLLIYVKLPNMNLFRRLYFVLKYDLLPVEPYKRVIYFISWMFV